MRIAGIQKLSLLDYPGKLAVTVFTAGCNFRCPFCHNADLVLPERRPPELSQEEVFSHLARRAGVIEGVCVTGGEPLLQEGLDAFLLKVKALGYDVKLDTNGSLPGRLEALLEKNLVDYVAMDVKNRPEKMAFTAGLPALKLQSLEKSVRLIRESGLPYEFRTTVVREHHSAEDIEAIARWLRGARRYVLQAFRDSGNLIEAGLHPVEEAQMRQMAELAAPHVEEVVLRGL